MFFEKWRKQAENSGAGQETQGGDETQEKSQESQEVGALNVSPINVYVLMSSIYSKY